MESANSVLAFYQDVMRLLAGNGIEFLVGGGFRVQLGKRIV
jgi:hypothetical protein